jgi:hypothetical protein
MATFRTLGSFAAQSGGTVPLRLLLNACTSTSFVWWITHNSLPSEGWLLLLQQPERYSMIVM